MPVSHHTHAPFAPNEVRPVVLHCRGCGDYLYDYTKFIEDEDGELQPTEWCCDCYDDSPEAAVRAMLKRDAKAS